MTGPLDVEEAACLETAAQRAHKIASMLSTGEIGPGLPPGYSFEFTPIDYRVADRMDLAAQVRGTAPEPPPDGFTVPPGMLEGLRDALMDAYGLPRDFFEPGPPPTRRQKLRRNLAAWRQNAARRAYRTIAGHWPGDGEDDW